MADTLELQLELFGIAAAKEARNIIEELGTTCRGSQTHDDGDVHTGEEPYETIEEYNEILSLGDALSRTPWGSNAAANRSYYIVDTGHNVTVKPKEEGNPESTSVERVEAFLKEWMLENDWHTRQSEVSQRLDRHGEVFDILYFDQEDGILKLSFAEPYDLMDDPNSRFIDDQDTNLPFFDSMGVRRTNDIRDRPVSYFIDNNWYDDLVYRSIRGMIPLLPDNSTLIQHRRRNALSIDRRGMTLYWTVREELTWAKKLLANLMRVSGFQSAFGAIRTISAMHSADAVKSHLNSLQTGTAGAGDSETFDQPAPSVVTIPSSVKYEFPETGAGQSNHIEVLVNLLRAAASGMKLPEFMLTANVSEGNFASTLVSEGPFHKGMRFEQNLMVKEDLRIIYQALRFAASMGVDGLTDADIDAVSLEVKPPRVQTRNRKEDFEVNRQMWVDRILSGKDYAASEDRDYDEQQNQIGTEIPAEFPEPLSVSGPAPTGPVPAPVKADQMSEKGVMRGEPTPIPEK